MVTHAVIDASAVAALYLELPWSSRVRAIVTERRRLDAPDLLVVELGSTFWKNVRAGIVSEEAAMEALRHAQAAVGLHPIAPLLEASLRIANERKHPIYDCFYIALAQREDRPLITADRRLAAVAGQAGLSVELLEA